MKRFGFFPLILILILTPFFFMGCAKTTVVDGVELSNVKIVVKKYKDSNYNDYRIVDYSCDVKNTTDKSLEFTVVYSYRGGSLLNPSTSSHNKVIQLSSGESISLWYKTDKIYGGILDEKKIQIKDVKEVQI